MLYIINVFVLNVEKKAINSDVLNSKFETAQGSPGHMLAPLPPYTEDSRGHVRKHGRAAPLGRIFSWGSTMKSVCGTHGYKCNRMFTYKTIPHADVLVRWLFDG